ncbi:MAG TPA: hypothetical protein VHY08_14225 [Bacillota bacterium]|nr:hypothetical protein [Bacillota bacterium]
MMGILFAGFLTSAYGAVDPFESSLIIHPLSLENRKIVRKQIMTDFIHRYKENQVFQHIQDYMNAKYAELHKPQAPRSPEVVMEDAFDNARSLMDITRKAVGNKFVGVYDPEQIDKKVRHYLWLKGVCFFVLGIGEEHKIAVSFFYVQGNEALKKQFMKDVVLYSFPEIPDVPENQNWLEKMTNVMDKLGYEIFSVQKYLGVDNNESESKTPEGTNEGGSAVGSAG